MTDDELRELLEQKQMTIKHLEQELQQLTKQNYDLMVRISELASLPKVVDDLT